VLQADYDSLYSAGAEYWIQNLVALRIGYKFGAFNHITLGAGIKYNNFEFDYAFVGYDELGNTHRFSMLYSWGTPPVKLSVFPAVFSPNSDNYLDTVVFAPVLKSKDKLNNLKITIYGAAGLAVAELPVKITDKGTQWKGDSTGTNLPDGIYKASLSAEYETGAAESEKVTVEIDNTPPQSRVDADPKLLKPGASDSLLIPATFTFFAQDRNKVAKWQFLIWDNNRKVFYNTGGSGEPPLSIIWDGKSADGEYVQTGAVYNYSLITYDSVGNKSQTKPQAQVVLLREIKLTFSSDAIFDTGMADVKITAYGILKDMKKVIAQHPESEIIVSGYTDNLQPRGIKYKDNTELSKSRADAVKFFMVNLLSMNGSIIRTEGMGEKNPVATNDTEEGRLKNRRVEITIRSTIYK
jgi:outer membrane protein OmpA-like peptidoglycan-associated protein